MGVVGGHISGGLAGATYGGSRGTHFRRPAQVIGVLGGQIFGGPAGATYGGSRGTHFWRPGRRNP